MFKEAKVGDNVWSIAKGWGIIEDNTNHVDYPIRVNYETNKESYTYDGKVFKDDLNPTLFWDEIGFEIPPKQLPRLAVDTKVLVWGNREDTKYKRYFKEFNDDSKIVCFQAGRTSFTAISKGTIWDNWELYEEDNSQTLVPR